ncbi:MAG TPA: ABC transporter permease [Acidimicrobiales bacterium]
MQLARTMLSKLARLAGVLVIVTLFAALLVSLVPGDPAEVIAPFASEGQRETIRDELNLNDPIPVQYVRWLGDFVTGDFGNFYTVSGSRPVGDRISDALPVSFQLLLYAQVLALLIAIPLGVLAAYRAGTKVDKATSSLAFAMLALPNFVLALVLAYYIGVKSDLVPPGGYVPFGEDFFEHARRMILPTVSLAVGQIAVYMRLLRSDMIATLQEDFITVARAKGLPTSQVLWRHALRPSSITLLTVAGLNVGTLIGGSVVIEVIFSVPGMGMLIYGSILERQYVALQSCVALIAVAYVLVNFFVDFLYTVIDPRIRHGRS